MPFSGFGKQPFRFGGKGKGMEVKKWQFPQVNFTLWISGNRGIGISGKQIPIHQSPDCQIT